MRAVAEWIGATDDTPPPPRVQLRVFERFNGICQCGCGVKIRAKAWDTDHKVALINGGQNRESNLVPMFVAHHKDKTKRDVAEKSKIYRKRAKHLGIQLKPKRKIPGRRFNGEPIRP